MPDSFDDQSITVRWTEARTLPYTALQDRQHLNLNLGHRKPKEKKSERVTEEKEINELFELGFALWLHLYMRYKTKMPYQTVR